MTSTTSSATSELSRSTSINIGATTPCSVSGASSIFSLPPIYVYFVGTSFTASTLEEIFKKHASDNRMGVIIDQNSVHREDQSFSCEGEWMPLSSSHGNGGSTLNYFISTVVSLKDHVLPVGSYHITCLPPPDPSLFYRPQPSYTRILHEQIKKLFSLSVVFALYFQFP